MNRQGTVARERIPPREFYSRNPLLLESLTRLEKDVEESGLDPRLIELVKVRVSQMNRCGYCLSRHPTEARRQGEDDRRLDILIAWRESAAYTAAERAALNWCEQLTQLAETGVHDEAFEQLTDYFDERGIVQLTTLILLMNSWNRIALSMRFRA